MQAGCRAQGCKPAGGSRSRLLSRLVVQTPDFLQVLATSLLCSHSQSQPVGGLRFSGSAQPSGGAFEGGAEGGSEAKSCPNKWQEQEIWNTCHIRSVCVHFLRLRPEFLLAWTWRTCSVSSSWGWRLMKCKPEVRNCARMTTQIRAS